ncbi:hypothetical protein CLIM01_04716 [Colletotrichum limetticola]|uniref:Uncharacterized protein n=1 Tax=Colletotrichum limetticola TaxID=1209924 RepID=A0ABQ9Q277_9PEZI|nr:hypothetical protein CLIM01_04716 [Colletotrichum limetticola]
MLRFLKKYLQLWEIEELSCIYCEIRTYYRMILRYPSGIVSCINPDTHFFKLVYQDLSTSNVFDVSEEPLSPAYDCFCEAPVTRGLERFSTIRNCEMLSPQLIPQLQDEVSIVLRNLAFQGSMVEGTSGDEDAIMERQLDRGGCNRLDHIFEESIRGSEIIDKGLYYGLALIGIVLEYSR